MWLPSKHLQLDLLRELPQSSLHCEKTRLYKEPHSIHLAATTESRNSTKVLQTQIRQGLEHIAK